MPSTKLRKQPIAKRRSAKLRRSTIGLAARSVRHANAAPAAAATARRPRLRGEVQPRSGASFSPISSAASAPPPPGASLHPHPGPRGPPRHEREGRPVEPPCVRQVELFGRKQEARRE